MNGVIYITPTVHLPLHTIIIDSKSQQQSTYYAVTLYKYETEVRGHKVIAGKGTTYVYTGVHN